MTDDRWGWSGDPDDPESRTPRPTPPDPAWAAMDSSPTSTWSATFDELAIQGNRDRARARARRRIVFAVSAVAVVATAAVVTGVVISRSGDSRPSTPATVAQVPQTPRSSTAPAAVVPQKWCETGTRGAVTTVSDGRDQKTPVGAVAAFLAATIDDRSATAARSTMSETAVVPTVAQLQQWISTLPATTNGWCAQITTTDSTARLLVDLRVRTKSAVAQVGSKDTFYVSASGPERWEIDAIVSDDGNRP